MGWFNKRKEKKPDFVVSNCVYACLKEKCPMWVILDSNYIVEGKPMIKQDGRCTFAWIPQLLIELRNKNGTNI